MSNHSSEQHQAEYIKKVRKALEKAGIDQARVSDSQIIDWYVCMVRVEDVVRVAQDELLQDEEGS